MRSGTRGSVPAIADHPQALGSGLALAKDFGLQPLGHAIETVSLFQEAAANLLAFHLLGDRAQLLGTRPPVPGSVTI